MGIGSRFQRTARGAVAELKEGDGEDKKPDPRGTTSSHHSSFQSRDYKTHKPPKKELQLYWAGYLEDSLLRRLINSYAREVVEPGWWVEADSDDTAKKMAKWLRKAAILEGEPDHDILLLIEKLAKQRLIRGSALVEHVPAKGQPDSFNSIQLLNPHTVTAFTQPKNNILWPPNPGKDSDDSEDDEDNEDEDTDDRLNQDTNKENNSEGRILGNNRNGQRRASKTNVPKNDQGEYCAYAQFYENKFSNRETALFTRNDITKFPKDADVGDIYGNSPLESVIERLDAMRKKIHDRDEAIHQKAWPTWIFKFGPDDDPWHPDDIDDFANDEEEDNFGPGTKHFVQGDIDVETVGGAGQYAVPDIDEPLKHDVRQIADGLPAPITVSSHASEMSKQLVNDKNQRYKKQVKQTRRVLEYRFKRILTQKAEQEGWDTEGLKLRIAHPEGQDPEESEAYGTTIRYVSNAGQGPMGEQRGQGNPEQMQQNGQANPQQGGQPQNQQQQMGGQAQMDYPDEYDSLTAAVDDGLADIVES